MNERTVKCFISYSHKDVKYFKRFLIHFNNIKRLFNIDNWYDGKIQPGQNIDKEVSKNLNDSDIIIFLLISPDYINSYYCYEKELTSAIKRSDENKCVVIPVILKVYTGEYPFNKLKFVPTDGKPITNFKPYDRGFTDAFNGINNLIKIFVENQIVLKKQNVMITY